MWFEINCCVSYSRTLAKISQSRTTQTLDESQASLVFGRNKEGQSIDRVLQYPSEITHSVNLCQAPGLDNHRCKSASWLTDKVDSGAMQTIEYQLF
jgi:hypothetical protein